MLKEQFEAHIVCVWLDQNVTEDAFLLKIKVLSAHVYIQMTSVLKEWHWIFFLLTIYMLT